MHTDLYYVLNTLDGSDIPHFTMRCLFCECFNNLGGNYIPGKSR